MAHNMFLKNLFENNKFSHVVMKVDPEKPQMMINKKFWRKDQDLLLKNYEECFLPDQSVPGAVHGKGKVTICYPTTSDLFDSCIMVPRLSAQFLVAESLDNVVLFLVSYGWFGDYSLL